MDYPTTHQTECNVTPRCPERSVCAAERQRRYEYDVGDGGTNNPFAFRYAGVNPGEACEL